MNVRLLRKIQKHIREEPKRFVMSRWFVKGKPGTVAMSSDYGSEEIAVPECGTVACVAGWALKLAGKRFGDENTLQSRAGKLLGLSDTPDDQRYRLFSVLGWPAKFGDAFQQTTDRGQRVRIAVRRIDHFIRTKGAE